VPVVSDVSSLSPQAAQLIDAVIASTTVAKFAKRFMFNLPEKPNIVLNILLSPK